MMVRILLVTAAAALLLVSPWIAAADLAHNHLEFVDGVTSQLYVKQTNQCTSSFGVSLVMDLLYPAGIESTQDEICNVVKVCETMQWNPTTNALLQDYNGNCASSYTKSTGEEVCTSQTPTLKIANSIWLDDDNEDSPQLKDEYAALVGQHVIKTDFQSANAGSVINAWASEQTNGYITSIVEDGPIPESIVMYAVNSIFLQAMWTHDFMPTKTNMDWFYSDGPKRMTQRSNPHYMHQVEYFMYSHNALGGYQVVQLPYQQSKLSMVLVLPLTTEASMQRPMAHDVVLQVLSELQRTRIALALPKFSYETSYSDELITALENIGLQAPFEEGQGFCGIMQEGCHFISKLIQKTLVQVTEFGTTAAAVTAAGVSPTSLPMETPIEFMANHAFDFYIVENNALVLFEGHVGDLPDGGMEDGVPLLQDSHLNANFWMDNFGVTTQQAVFNTTLVEGMPFAQEMEPTKTNEPGSSTSSTPPPTTTTSSAMSASHDCWWGSLTTLLLLVAAICS